MEPWNCGCSDPLWGAAIPSGFKNRPNWSVKWRSIGNNQLFSKIEWVSILEGPVLINNRPPDQMHLIWHVFPQLHKWKLWKGLVSTAGWLYDDFTLWSIPESRLWERVASESTNQLCGSLSSVSRWPCLWWSHPVPLGARHPSYSLPPTGFAGALETQGEKDLYKGKEKGWDFPSLYD